MAELKWEKVLSGSQGMGLRYGEDWKTVPAIAVSSIGITFNRPASNIFKLNAGNRVWLHVSKDGVRAIGFKHVLDNEPAGGSYLLVSQSKTHKTKSGENPLVFIHAKSILKDLADCRGYAFRACLNSSDRIIEVVLDPSNRCK